VMDGEKEVWKTGEISGISRRLARKHHLCLRLLTLNGRAQAQVR
jgi:hypothetical protein